MLYRSTKSKIQLLWRQNDLGYPFYQKWVLYKEEKERKSQEKTIIAGAGLMV